MGHGAKGAHRGLTARFWAKVQKSDCCWEWAGAVNPAGYGVFSGGGRSWMAHRFAWEAANCAVPQGLCVLHHCDTPACVRPDHLYVGTQNDNAQDRCAAILQRRTKLPRDEVVELRRQLVRGEVSREEFARRFGGSSVGVFISPRLRHVAA